jgi:ATP-dependent Lon protease
MATALASLASGRPVRNDVAMTGEITLTGQVLPVGGIKEKVLAAQRAKLREVILPDRNEADVAEIPEHERGELEFHFVDEIGKALVHALEGPPDGSPSKRRAKAAAK